MSRSSSQLYRTHSAHSAASSTSTSSSASTSASTPRHRILCFGDSLTEGYTKRGMIMHAYARKLDDELKGEYIIDESGVSGEVTESMTKRLVKILDNAATKEKYPYSLVILLGGTNDVCHELATSEIISRLRQLHESCHAHSSHTRTIGMTVPEIDTPKPGTSEAMRGPRSIDRAMTQINQTMKDWKKEEKSASADSKFDPSRYNVFDLCEMLPQHTPGPTSTKELWDSDAVHFTEKGYDWIGERLAEFIQKNKLLE